MDRKQVDETVQSLLLPFVQVTIGNGPDSMLALANALHAYARKVEEIREEMTVSPVWRCADCGRHWTSVLTVKVERSCNPDNCPECFNAKQSADHRAKYGPSKWLVFRYVTAPAEGD